MQDFGEFLGMLFIVYPLMAFLTMTIFWGIKEIIRATF